MFSGGSTTESERKAIGELERAAQGIEVRGLGVGVTGPSQRHGLDSIRNWDKEGEYSRARVLWNCKKEVRLLAPEVYSPRWVPIVEESGWEDIKLR